MPVRCNGIEKLIISRGSVLYSQCTWTYNWWLYTRVMERMRFQSLSPKNISLVESSILPLFLGSGTAFSPTKSINHKHPYQIYKKKNLYHYTLSYTYYLPIFIIMYFFYVSNILSVFTTIKTLLFVFTRYIVSQKCLLQLKFSVVIFLQHCSLDMCDAAGAPY